MRNSKLTVVLAFLLGALVAAGLILKGRGTRTGEASATLRIRPVRIEPLESGYRRLAEPASPLEIEAIAARVRTTPVLEAALDGVALHGWPAHDGRPRAEIVREIADGLEVRLLPETSLVRVTLRHPDERNTARILNAVVDAFARAEARRVMADAEEVLNVLEVRWMDAKNKADLKRNEVKKLMERHGRDRDVFPLELESLRDGLVDTQEELFKTQVEIARRKGELGPEHEEIARLRATESALEESLELLKASFSELSGLKRPFDDFEADAERYDREAARHFADWERLQSSRELDPGPVEVEVYAIPGG